MIDLKEIPQVQGKGYLILDMALFSQTPQEYLSFGFSINGKEPEDYRINHRYPNKMYQTISKTYGRKLSRIGYPYPIDLDKQEPIELQVHFGTFLKPGSDRILDRRNYIFRIQTEMTEKESVCGLSLTADFDSDDLVLMTQKENAIGGWSAHAWRNYVKYGYEDDTRLTMDGPICLSDHGEIYRYRDIIIPAPSSREKLMVTPVML